MWYLMKYKSLSLDLYLTHSQKDEWSNYAVIITAWVLSPCQQSLRLSSFCFTSLTDLPTPDPNRTLPMSTGVRIICVMCRIDKLQQRLFCMLWNKFWMMWLEITGGKFSHQIILQCQLAKSSTGGHTWKEHNGCEASAREKCFQMYCSHTSGCAPFIEVAFRNCLASFCCVIWLYQHKF